MDCIFCKIINGEIPSKKVYEDNDIIAIMDINPTVDGHLLIMPKKHYEDITTLPDNIYLNMKEVAIKLTDKIFNNLDKTGVTLSINYGTSQDIKHVHMHLLPDLPEIKNKLSVTNLDIIYDKIKN